MRRSLRRCLCVGFWNLESLLPFKVYSLGRSKKGTIVNRGNLSSFCLDSLHLSLLIWIADGGTVYRPLSVALILFSLFAYLLYVFLDFFDEDNLILLLFKWKIMLTRSENCKNTFVKFWFVMYKYYNCFETYASRFRFIRRAISFHEDVLKILGFNIFIF